MIDFLFWVGNQGEPVLIEQAINKIFDPQIQSINLAVQSLDNRVRLASQSNDQAYKSVNRIVQRIAQSVSNKFESQDREISFQINNIRSLGNLTYIQSNSTEYLGDRIKYQDNQIKSINLMLKDLTNRIRNAGIRL